MCPRWRPSAPNADAPFPGADRASRTRLGRTPHRPPASLARRLSMARPAYVTTALRRKPMLNSKTLDELAARIGKALEGSPAKDIEKNLKAIVQHGRAQSALTTPPE